MRGLLILLLAASTGTARADTATDQQQTVDVENGASVYQHVCQSCHMPGGTGAVGAGRFPALAGNRHLAVASYPIGMVLNGNGGMPWFNGVLTDKQIADVVNYVRTHFGNNYADVVTEARVAAQKRPAPVMER